MSETLTVTMTQSKMNKEEEPPAAAAATAAAATNADQTKEEEDKDKYKDYPFRNIKEPHLNDVLYGRGGGTNHHPGNKRYRKMVEDHKVEYVACKRLDKPLVALSIIREWRGQKPPGRFLKMDDNTGLWNDVGDKKAREKTSQALREKAPQIRLELDRERRERQRAERGGGSDSEDDGQPVRTTRFAEGTNMHSSRPETVARDHSLGVEYLDPAESVTLEGFSWQEPVHSNGVASAMSMERVGSQSSYQYPHLPPPPYPHPGSHPGSRIGSCGSFSVPPQPPPGAIYPPDRMPSWARFESWGSMGPPVPPPPPPPAYGYPPPPTHHSGSWDTRDHSLAQNPLLFATATQAAYPSAFEHSRTSSGNAWGPPQPPYSPMGGPPHYQMPGGPPPPPPPPPPPAVAAPAPAAAAPEQRRRQHPSPSPPSPSPPSQNPPPSPKYSVDVKVASQWSGQDPRDIAKTLSEDSRDKFEGVPKGISNGSASSSSSRYAEEKKQEMPKPDLVKRMTSNQNETYETKPEVKRAALNREGSLASNRLKQKYMPGYFDTRREVETLSLSMRQSSITDPTPKPSLVTNEDRMTTLDMSALDLVVRPMALGTASRSTTIDALNLDFEDPFGKGQMDWLNSSDREGDDDEGKQNDGSLSMPSRPAALSQQQRLTTTDLIDIVNGPLVDD